MNERYLICGDTAYGPGSGLWTGDGWTVDEQRWPALEFASRAEAQVVADAMNCRELNPKIIQRKDGKR